MRERESSDSGGFCCVYARGEVKPVSQVFDYLTHDHHDDDVDYADSRLVMDFKSNGFCSASCNIRYLMGKRREEIE